MEEDPRSIPLWPFAVLLILIAVAVTLHAEGPDFERGQEIAVEAELCDYSCASACGESRLSREVESTVTAMPWIIDATDRTHVVQHRPEVSSANFDSLLVIDTTGESRHLSCEAVGSAGVCSASHLSHRFLADSRRPYHDETTAARPRYRGGAA
jgi:hypothetical protein